MPQATAQSTRSHHPTLPERVLAHLRAEGREVLDLGRDRSWLEALTPAPYVLLHRMERRGLLHRLQWGRYQAELSGLPAEAPTFDSLEAMAPALLDRLGHECYLSWHSALYHHGLIEQQSSTVFAAVSERKRPAQFDGYAIRFVQVPEDRFDGGYRVERDGHSRLNIATVERALVDSFDRPRYAGPYALVAAALLEAWEMGDLRPERLLAEVIGHGKHAVARRLGFFMERWNIPGAAELRPHLGRGYAVPLAPGGQGYEPGTQVDSRWGVVLDHGLILTAEHPK